MATRHNRLETLRYLLSRAGFSVNGRGNEGYTPLHWAVRNGRLDAVKYLLTRADINVNALSRDYYDYEDSPLHWAVRNGHMEIMRHLLAHDGIDANVRSSYYRKTPLHVAVEHGRREMAEYILSRDDVDVNAGNFLPLHLSARHGQWEMVEYFLSRSDIGINARDYWGATPLDEAVSSSSSYAYRSSETAGMIVPALRARGGVCLTRTDDACGLVMRPLRFSVTIPENHSGAAHTVVAADPLRSGATITYSLASGAGFSVNSTAGVLFAESGILTEGLVVTVLIEARAEGGTQTATVERVVSVSAAPTLAGVLSDYPSRLTAAAGYAGAVATLSAEAEGATVFYRSGLDAGVFSLAVLPSGKAALSLVSPLGAEGAVAAAVVELRKHGYIPATVAALVTVSALGPFDREAKEIEADHAGTVHQFTLSGFEGAQFSAAEGSSSDFEVSSDGAVSRKENVILEGETVYTVAVEAEDEGFLGAVSLTLGVSVYRKEARAEFSASSGRYRAALAGGYAGAVLTLSSADERVSLSYLGGLDDGSAFSLVSLSSGDYVLSLGAAVSGPDVAVLEPSFEFQRTGFPSASATADIKVTALGPYSHSAVIQKSATSVAYRFVVPGFSGAEFEVEGSEDGGFYSVSSNGTIALISPLTASVSHTVTVRGRHAGFFGDALFTLALSVSSCDADVRRESEDDSATLNSRLIRAAKDGNAGAVCDLLQQGADVGARENSDGGDGYFLYDMTALNFAARNGHLDVVKYLLSRGDVDANARNAGGQTPLYLAASNGHLDVVKHLLSRGDVDANARSVSNFSPLHEAASNGHLDVVKHLLSRGDVDVNARDDYFRYTPLHLAVQGAYLDADGDLGVMKYLLSRDGVDARAQDRWGKTPLHWAAEFGLLDAVKHLLLKTPINSRSPVSGTPLDSVIAESYYYSQISPLTPVLSTLRALGGVCLVRTDEACGLVMRPLHSTVFVAQNHDGAAFAVTATTHGDASPVYKLIHLSANSDNFSFDSATGELTARPGVLAEGLLFTVSIQAAAGAQSVTVERVVSVSALPVLAGVLSDYPSRLTAAAGHMGVVATLSAMEEGATVFYHSGLDAGVFSLAALPSGKAALSLISPLGGEGAVASAVVELRKSGYIYIPATVAALVTVSALLPAQEQATVFSGSDFRFQLSAQYGGTRYEKISGPAGLSVSDSGEISASAPPLPNAFDWHHLEARADSPGILGGERFSVSLLAAPCPSGAPPTSGEAANLIEAVNRGVGIDGICRMILAGADVNAQNSNKATPLHRAVVGEYYAAASLLIAAGAEVDAQNKKGKTPLYLAASLGRAGMASLLLSAGADATLAINDGDTPLRLAIRLSRVGMVSLFLSAGEESGLGRDSGGDALRLATELRRVGMVSLLLSAGADANLANNAGDTPLHLATRRKRAEGKPSLSEDEKIEEARKMTEIASLLLMSGASLTVFNSGGMTPFSAPLVPHDHVGQITPDLYIHDGVTSLYDYDILSVLGAHAEGLPASDVAAGGAALRNAASSGGAEAVAMVSLMLSLGADVDAASPDDGATPLYRAVENRRSETARALLAAGANPNLPDGRTPLDKAVENGLDGVIAEIKAAGGVCLTRTEEACGLILRPLLATVTIGARHSGFVHAITGHPINKVGYAVINDDTGFYMYHPDIYRGELFLNSGAVLTEGTVITVSITGEHGGSWTNRYRSNASYTPKQKVTIERLVTVAPLDGRLSSDYPSRATAAAGYSGAVATLSAAAARAAVSYHSGLDTGKFSLTVLRSGKAAELFLAPLPGGGTVVATAVLETGKYGYIPALATALVTVAVMRPFAPESKEIASDYAGVVHQFALSSFQDARFSAAGEGDANFDVSSDGGVSLKDGVTLEAGARHEVAVRAEDDGFLGAAALTLSVSVHRSVDATAMLRRRLAMAGGHADLVLTLTLSSTDADVLISHAGDGLDDGSPFSLISVSSGKFALSLTTAATGPDVLVATPSFVFRKAGLSPAKAKADIQVTILGPYSVSAVIQHNAASVAHHFSIPGFADARFSEIGSGDFYSVLENGKISLHADADLELGASHTISARGEDDGFAGDALFILALSVSFCESDASTASDAAVETLNSMLLQAVLDGDAAGVCDLLRKGADMEDAAHAGTGGADRGRYPRGGPYPYRYYDDLDERTLLHYAARDGHLEVVKYLSSRDDVDVNARDSDASAPDTAVGNTPLHMAAGNHHWDAVKYLASRDDVDVLASDFRGQTALDMAVVGGALEIVKYLASRDDVDAEMRATGGYARLLHAAADLDIAKYLASRGEVDAGAGTALHRAAERGALGVVKYLASRDDVDADARDGAGKTPLYYAVSGSHFDVADYLLSRGDVDRKLGADGDALLISAVRRIGLDLVTWRSDLDLVKYLLRPGGVEVNSLAQDDEYGFTALHWAALSASEPFQELRRGAGAKEVLEHMLSLGVDPHARDSRGYTPLHWAAALSHLDMLDFWLARADTHVNVRASNGHTPLDVSHKRGNSRPSRLPSEDGLETFIPVTVIVQGNSALLRLISLRYFYLRDISGWNPDGADHSRYDNVNKSADKLHAKGGVCLVFDCGFVARPAHATVIIGAEQVNFGILPAAVVVAGYHDGDDGFGRTSGRSLPKFSVISGDGFSMATNRDGRASHVVADRRAIVLTAGLVATVSILVQAERRGVTSRVTVDRVIKVVPKLTASLPDYPTHVTVAASYTGPLAQVADVPFAARWDYETPYLSRKSPENFHAIWGWKWIRPLLDNFFEEDDVFGFRGAGAWLSLLSPLGGEEKIARTTGEVSGGYSYTPVPMTVLMTVTSLDPFPLVEKEIEADHTGLIHQFALDNYDNAVFSGGGGLFEVSPAGAVSPKANGILEGGRSYQVVVQARDKGFLGPALLTLNVSVREWAEFSEDQDQFHATVAGGYRGAVLTLTTKHAQDSLSYDGGLETNSPFSLISPVDSAGASPPSREVVLSLGADVSGPGIVVLNPRFRFMRQGYGPETKAADIRVTVLGPYSDSAVIKDDAVSVEYRFSIPGFPDAAFEGMGDNGIFSVSSDGTISWDLNTPLAGGVSHRIVARGEDDGFLGGALLTLALSVTFSEGVLSLNWQLLSVVEHGDDDVGLVRDLLRQGASGRATDWRGETPLHYAAYYGRVKVAKYLTSRGDVDVNARRDHDGRTPLHIAVRAYNDKHSSGRPDRRRQVAEHLMSLDNVNVNARDDSGHTPLNLAFIYYNHADPPSREAIISSLMSLDRIHAGMPNNDGLTPLHYAALYGLLSWARQLAPRSDVNADARDNLDPVGGIIDSGRSPLHVAVDNPDVNTVKLVDYLASRNDVDANGRDDKGRTPFFYAAIEAAYDYSSRGSPPWWSSPDLDSLGVYTIAVSVLRLLASRDDVDVNTPDNNGRAPLDYIVSGHLNPGIHIQRRGSWSYERLRRGVEVLRSLDSVCLIETHEICGIVMRPLHSTLTISVNHSGAVHTVTATNFLNSDAATIYSLVYSNGLSLTVNSETGVLFLAADSGILTEGLVATVSVRATTEGGTQSAVVEIVIVVSAVNPARLFHPPLQLIPPAENQFKPPKLARVRPPKIPEVPAKIFLGAPPLPPPSRFRVSFFHA